jgi:large subunit ribosomal protein L25
MRERDMEQSEVIVRKREEKGKGPVGRLRRQGWVPAVIYGHGSAAEPLAVEKRGLQHFFDTGHHIVELKQEGDGGVRKALVREVQVQPVTQEVLHVDFVEISEHERVKLAMRLIFRGEAAGIKDGGVFYTVLHEVEIACPADAVIDELRVDVSGLELGQALHVRELLLPENVEAVTDGDQVVATVRLPKGEPVEEGVAVAGAVEGEVGPAQPEVISEQKREEREKNKEAG